MASTYTIYWQRIGDQSKTLRCTGLKAKVAFARMQKALKCSGSIILIRIVRERKK